MNMTKALVLVQLLVLLPPCFSIVLSQEVDAVVMSNPPAQSPTPTKKNPPSASPPSKPPTRPPVVQPPSHPPVQPPSQPPSYPGKRRLLAVQGVVYCKPCKYQGVETLLEATPLVGAVVKLQCNNTKQGIVQQSKTDKNGYFLIMPQKTITSYASHKCRVFLVSSPPLAKCTSPTDLHRGRNGAPLVPLKQAQPDLPYQLFSVGPFAFEPAVKC